MWCVCVYVSFSIINVRFIPSQFRILCCKHGSWCNSLDWHLLTSATKQLDMAFLFYFKSLRLPFLFFQQVYLWTIHQNTWQNIFFISFSRGANLHWPHDSITIMMHLSVWHPQWSICLHLVTFSSFKFPFYSESPSNKQTTAIHKINTASLQ